MLVCCKRAVANGRSTGSFSSHQHLLSFQTTPNLTGLAGIRGSLATRRVGQDSLSPRSFPTCVIARSTWTQCPAQRIHLASPSATHRQHHKPHRLAVGARSDRFLHSVPEAWHIAPLNFQPHPCAVLSCGVGSGGVAASVCKRCRSREGGGACRPFHMAATSMCPSYIEGWMHSAASRRCVLDLGWGNKKTSEQGARSSVV